jgi:cobalt-precorrin 5A hydrolase
MVGDKTMIAIGVGCRRGSWADTIETLVRQALAQTSAADRPGLFTIEDKAQEPGLIEAANRLGLNLTFLPRNALRAQSAKIQTRSSRAESLFGVPAVAEAAALAGAGPNATLIVPRIARQGVTCAIAAAP